MTFRDRFKNPSTAIPIGMVFLVLAIAWPLFFHPATKFAQDLSDGIRGLLFGLSIGINLFSVVLSRRNRRCASN
jgi:hypothetical protein